MNIIFNLNVSNIDLSIAYKDVNGQFYIKSNDGCFVSIRGNFEIDKRVEIINL